MIVTLGQDYVLPCGALLLVSVVGGVFHVAPVGGVHVRLGDSSFLSRLTFATAFCVCRPFGLSSREVEISHVSAKVSTVFGGWWALLRSGVARPLHVGVLRVKPVSQDVLNRYFALRSRGVSQARASKMVGIGRSTAHKYEKEFPDTEIGKIVRHQEESKAPDPIPFDELGENAARALEDFDFFRRHYLGRDTVPWQVDAAEQIGELLETPNDEYVVVNVPPGSGKSTLFTCDIPTWLVIRDRAIRMQIGSRTHRLSKDYTGLIRRILTRPMPMEGAEGVIQNDFGRFKPEDKDLWKRDEYIVEQLHGHITDMREPTITAVAQDTGFLGNRADFVIWDDLVASKNSRTVEMRDQLQEWYETEAETRLEPGGLLVLQGQRISPDDLYRFALSLKLGEAEEVVELNFGEIDDRPQKYHHIIYPAHFDDECEGDHGKQALAWPEGCLLDPHRLSGRKLSMLRANNPRRYDITYQQKDVDTADQLVQWSWLEGGVGEDGSLHPGCLDKNRSICQLPEGLVGPLVSVASVDPSPTKWWSIQWWIVDLHGQTRYLMDHSRTQMDAPDFLDRLQNGKHVGVAEDWQVRSVDLGWPITHWIVEHNAAQRFLLQYEFVHQWIGRHSVELIPHATHSNKSDPEFGVQTLAPHYRYGRVNLPWDMGYGQKASKHLVDELLKWPGGNTEDCVMANWFMEFHLPQLQYFYESVPEATRPSWMVAKFARSA